MAYEPKDNAGSLFKNDRATTDKHPQATGSAMIDGVDYFVDAWTNVDRNGNRYQSLKFKRKDKQARAENPPERREERSYRDVKDSAHRAHQPLEDDQPLDDEIPF